MVQETAKKSGTVSVTIVSYLASWFSSLSFFALSRETQSFSKRSILLVQKRRKIMRGICLIPAINTTRQKHCTKGKYERLLGMPRNSGVIIAMPAPMRTAVVMKSVCVSVYSDTVLKATSVAATVKAGSITPRILPVGRRLTSTTTSRYWRPSLSMTCAEVDFKIHLLSILKIWVCSAPVNFSRRLSAFTYGSVICTTNRCVSNGYCVQSRLS
mmetsp:Transcript_16235/g.47415  ORF Transcript_16235/g.47415 Transcript_16235/m.47415 type:complete len:213 (+) Transcript_16235:135-773(+)